ncbi:hypothetical protein COB87_001165 [Candidatus Wolfebacteria bacterium]|nr:hypothetical protein [Candidatus Wolfebacteria bacterium]
MIDIQTFSETHQRYFGLNIVFGKTKNKVSCHETVVTVEVKTFFGTFIGEGSNKKAAKANATEKALSSTICPFLNR